MRTQFVPTAANFQQAPPSMGVEEGRSGLGLLFGHEQRQIVYANAPARIGDDYAISRAGDEAFMGTIGKLKEHIASRLGKAVKGFEVEYADNLPDCIDFVALIAWTGEIDRVLRMALREELNKIISSSESPSVRERVIVNFR